MDHNANIAVVGAGPGGLAAAVLLAAKGVGVTVYEAQDQIGGRTSRIDLDGYAFDRGPTFFLMPHVLQEIFQAAGRDLHEEVRLVPLDPMYRLVIGQENGPDTTIDTTQDLAEMARRLSRIHPPDGANFDRFVRHNRAKLDASEPILRRSIRSVLDLARPDALKAAPLIKPWHTVDSLSAKYFEHPASRIAVGFQSKYLGMSPYECPSLFTILPFIEYEYGVWHPIGGCNALMRALADVLLDLGGRIESGTPVKKVRTERGRVRALELGGARDGETVRCDHAVINADATWALKNFFPESDRGRMTDSSIDRKRYSCSTFMLYLGVEGEVDLPHHTIRTSPNYRGNLDDIGRADGYAGSLTADPSFYICNPCRTDPSLAPPGDSALYVLMPTPNTRAPIDWTSIRDDARSLLLERADSVLGVDLRGRIKRELIVTPDDWAASNINFGATFNLAHSLDQMLHKRPQHRLPFADGAWLVGGGTHPGSGLPVIFLSAQITAGMLLDELGHSPAREPSRSPAVTDYEPSAAGVG